MIPAVAKFCKISKYPQHYLFCNTKFLAGLRKQRSRLLLQDSTESFKEYSKICQEAKIKLGDEFEGMLMKQGFTPPVPGLIYIPNLLSNQDLSQLQQKCVSLYENLCQKQAEKEYTNKSYNHNLAADKFYKVLHIVDDSSPTRAKLDAQMFKNYGSGDHDLTYFIDNKNIPVFVKQILVAKLAKLPVVQDLKRQQEELNWRLTFNIYKENKEEDTGFLWHKDIAVNGIMTSITTVLGDGYFEIKPDDPDSQVSYKLKLSSNSLVVLSGDSRWRWVHRVIRKHQDSVSAGIINRISLVLGCR